MNKVKYRPFSSIMETSSKFRKRLHVVGKMPTTCAVVSCHNRHSKQCGLRFYRFPTNKDHCCLWIAFCFEKES